MASIASAGSRGRTTTTYRDGPDGFRTARVVASADGVRVVTPVAVEREPESYDVTLRHIGRDGPLTGFVTSLNRLDDGTALDVRGPSPEQKVRLRTGSYGLYSWIYGPADTTMLVQPDLAVDGPTTVTLDARRAAPVAITVPRPDASLSELSVQVQWEIGGAFPIGAIATGDVFLGDLGGPARDGFTATIQATYGGSASYDLAYLRRGRFFTGFTRKAHVPSSRCRRSRATTAWRRRRRARPRSACRRR